jgi:hypothetical protein
MSTTDTTPVDIWGLIVSEKHSGNGKREIILQEEASSASNASSFTSVLLDGATTRTKKWFTIKKARNLLYPGVGLHVTGYRHEENILCATSIAITSVHPSKQYLARLLSFSVDQLQILFSSDENHHQGKKYLPTDLLLDACAPLSLDELQHVHQHCQEERLQGRGATLWKTLPIEKVSTRLYQHQSTNAIVQPKPKNLKMPRVSNSSLESVQRLEGLYLRLPSDGTVENYTFDETTQSYVSSAEGHATFIPQDETVHHYGNYDPCRNLPNPKDARRLKYVDQRKRPQVQWMLNLVQQWMNKTNEERRTIHVVDIGGGRGYFGIAVAAFFPTTMHVTIVDCNESSLQAGKTSASAAGLVDNIEFVYCDLNDSFQVQELLERQDFDLVLGLHCCGGLAEAAVELAIQCRADFCVSTCCFRSHPELASLTRLAEQIRMQSTSEEACQYKEDVSLVAALAVTVGGKGQHSAIRAYNSMRLVAAEARFNILYTDSVLRTWQEMFPVEYSVQNRVLMGTIVQKQ